MPVSTAGVRRASDRLGAMLKRLRTIGKPAPGRQSTSCTIGHASVKLDVERPWPGHCDFESHFRSLHVFFVVIFRRNHIASSTTVYQLMRVVATIRSPVINRKFHPILTERKLQTLRSLRVYFIAGWAVAMPLSRTRRCLFVGRWTSRFCRRWNDRFVVALFLAGWSPRTCFIFIKSILALWYSSEPWTPWHYCLVRYRIFCGL